MLWSNADLLCPQSHKSSAVKTEITTLQNLKKLKPTRSKWRHRTRGGAWRRQRRRGKRSRSMCLYNHILRLSVAAVPQRASSISHDWDIPYINTESEPEPDTDKQFEHPPHPPPPTPSGIKKIFLRFFFFFFFFFFFKLKSFENSFLAFT